MVRKLRAGPTHPEGPTIHTLPLSIKTVERPKNGASHSRAEMSHENGPSAFFASILACRLVSLIIFAAPCAVDYHC